MSQAELVEAGEAQTDKGVPSSPPVAWPPKVWLMMGRRAGDNTQVLAMAEALGWPFEIKTFVHQPFELITNLLFGATLAGCVASKSSRLEPPWPDVIISAGRRNEPICRWVQKQAKPEKHVRLIHMGRPWAYLHRFDLVVTTPQYRLPDHPSVLQNNTPMHRVSQERLQRDGVAWAPRLAHLPRPYIVVIAGGNSGPYSFDQKAGARLGRQASELARKLGGSLLVTTSARTKPKAIAAMQRSIDVPHFFYRWTPGARDNPYFGFLALADRLIVTGDSVSMLAEACSTRKPVYIFDPGEGWRAMRRWRKRGRCPFWRPVDPFCKRAFFYLLMMHLGPKRLSRDIRIIHDYLIDSGRAAWLGEGEPQPDPPPLDDIQRAVERAYALFGAKPSPQPA